MRRLHAEAHALAARARELTRALPDPSGRKRAERELDETLAELDAIVLPTDASVDSDTLDAAVSRLLSVDRKLTLQHEALTIAVSRSAVAAGAP